MEIALLLPLVAMLLLGTVTTGDAYFRRIGLTDAVREGGRYGASLAPPATLEQG